eukprot:5458264-Prymnesium_polylepis.1
MRMRDPKPSIQLHRTRAVASPLGPTETTHCQSSFTRLGAPARRHARPAPRHALYRSSDTQPQHRLFTRPSTVRHLLTAPTLPHVNMQPKRGRWHLHRCQPRAGMALAERYAVPAGFAARRRGTAAGSPSVRAPRCWAMRAAASAAR